MMHTTSIKSHFLFTAVALAAFGVLIVFGEVNANGQHPAQPESAVEITGNLTKSAYLYGESVFLVLRRVNTMSSDVNVESLYPMHNLQLFVVDENGNKLPHTGLQLSLVGPPRRTKVAPGDTVLEVFNISFEFGTPLLAGALTRGFQTGEYILSVRCREADVDVAVPDQRFSVIEPVERERAAFNSWIASETARREAGRESSRVILRDFIRNFPESQYFPDVCHNLWVLDGAREQYWSELLIDHFPNSGFVWQAMGVYFNSISPAEREVRLDSLSQVHHGTLVDEYVKYRRKVNYHRPGEQDR